MKYGFDNAKYLKIQSEHIKERIAKFGDKLYMEFLPGFEPDSKLQMLMQLKDELEMIIVISAVDIEKNKMRADLGITYDMDVLRLRDEFMARGFSVNSVVITHFNGQASAEAYRKRLENMDIRVYYHYTIEGYPNNVSLIDSDEGFGRNDFVETTRPLVVVTAPGPGSGKMAVCLSQLYQENKRGVKAGYAKFETFPVWSLSLTHPVNVAYEAATADLDDVNMIDPFHMDAYGVTAVNYNRDIEIFPVMNALFEDIYGEAPYKSPTDMGVNMIGSCICDDEVCREASRQEIIRRYFTGLCNLADGKCTENEVNKLSLLMKRAKLTVNDRRCVVAARERLEKAQKATSAMELEDGTILTGETSPLLGPSAALLLNAIKHLAGIAHNVKLIPQTMIEPIQKLKVDYLHGHNPRLHTDEVLVAISMMGRLDENCRLALEQLPNLKGAQVHSTVMLSEVDRKTWNKLGIGLTCDPVRKIKKLG